MSVSPSDSRDVRRRAQRLPVLLTSSVARVVLALAVSAALWLMTGWAMGWSW